ncbi:MAG: AAA family ATPase [Actinomycetaceae bacterium]|nr:AAA family ATPase [Actinomycetaceae bacterium]
MSSANVLTSPWDGVIYDDPELSQVRSGQWLDGQDFPPLAWMVPSLIPEGAGLLVGAPKLGKSWLALSMCLQVADGGTVLGACPVDPRPVLYLAMEDGNRRLQDRARKLMHGRDIPEAFEYVTRLEYMQNAYKLIAAWLHQHPNGFVVCDTLQKVRPPQTGRNVYAEDYDAMGNLKQLVDIHPGSGLLAVHHTNKARGGDFMDATSGSNGINGAADYTALLTRARNQGDGLLQLTGRDVIEAEYALKFDSGRWNAVGNDLAIAADAARADRDKGNLSEDMMTVLEYVRTNGTVTPSQVAEFMGWTPNQAGIYLRRLVEKGKLIKTERGKYAAPA